MKTITTKFGTVSYPQTVGSSNGIVDAKLWERDDKCRIYFTVYFNGDKADCGYFDVANNKSFLSSRPVNIARNIESEITIN